MPSAWSFAWTRALPARHTHFGICHIVQHVVILHAMWAKEETFKTECAQMARVTSGGRFHPDSCRFDLVADEGLSGRPGRPKPRDEGHLGQLSDPTGRNASEA